MEVIQLSEIKARMVGRLALFSDEEAELLMRVVAACPGDHVEIGTLWGGTAVLAALVKKEQKLPGHVYSIDFMQGGFWDNGDPATGTKPTPGAILDNLITFGVAHRVSLLKCKSHPWPLPAYLKPDTVLIDGDHSYEGCLRDWENVKKIKPHYVLFHDYDAQHPGVMRVVDTDVQRSRFRLFAQVGSLICYASR